MVKSLVQKIAPYVFAGLTLIGGGCSTPYEKTVAVNNNVVFYNTKGEGFPFLSWDIKEVKSDGTEILYDINPKLYLNKSNFEFELVNLAINNKAYSSTKDSIIFNKAKKRIKSLVDRYYSVKDSVEKSNEALRAFGK